MVTLIIITPLLSFFLLNITFLEVLFFLKIYIISIDYLYILNNYIILLMTYAYCVWILELTEYAL